MIYNYKIKTRNMHISEVFLSKFNFFTNFLHTYVHTYIPQVENQFDSMRNFSWNFIKL